ncbi:mannose-6-phosphate isomerase-like protein (cupin superfamily) [Bradyrhizobium sp. USDA 4354]
MQRSWLEKHRLSGLPTVKPGDLVIIPKGTAHGGTKPISGQVKASAIKTPPQAPGEVKLLD